jgi:hypothetical protein
MDDNRPDDTPSLIEFIDEITNGGPRAMVDLADVARKHYFHPSTKGSCSIKKVLPAVMQSAPILKATYSVPIYGATDGIPSKNFKDMVWWNLAGDGTVTDPYKLLLSPFDDSGDDAEVEAINQGGAASYAYLRLQFEDLTPTERLLIEHALLRYCELDTLAMVMILQGWDTH